jgi:hypothetical protein
MKKILFTSIVAMTVMAASVTNAQPYWGSSGIPTYTAGQCTIGNGANINDSRLHIKNIVPTNVTQFSASSVPEILINRNYPDATTSTYFTTDPNYFEIWRSDYYYPTPALNYVITKDFKVGIGLASPSYKLDVAGDFHCSDNATVGGDIYISHSNDALWRNIFANANATGLALYSKSATYDGPAIMMTGNSASTYAGDMRFFDGSGENARFVFGKPASGSANGSMVEQVVVEGSGDISMPRDNDNTWRNLYGNADHAGLAIHSHTSSSNGSSIELYGSQQTDAPGHIHFICNNDGTDPNGVGFNFFTYDPTNTWVSNVRIYKDGKMAIGADDMNTPSGYKLYVEEGILTAKLKVAVKNSSEWSDYVFADNYKLNSLHDVESYINTNKHLPGVPSANEVVKSGVDMAQMDATLLKKIEELTLYSIQQQKQIEQLQGEVQALLGASTKNK